MEDGLHAVLSELAGWAKLQLYHSVVVVGKTDRLLVVDYWVKLFIMHFWYIRDEWHVHHVLGGRV